MICAELYDKKERFSSEYFNRPDDRRRRPGANDRYFFRKIVGREFDVENVQDGGHRTTRPLYETRVKTTNRPPLSFRAPVYSLCHESKPSVRMRVSLSGRSGHCPLFVVVETSKQQQTSTYSCDLTKLFKELYRRTTTNSIPAAADGDDDETENYYEEICTPWTDDREIETAIVDRYYAEIVDDRTGNRIGDKIVREEKGVVAWTVSDLRPNQTIRFRRILQRDYVRILFLGSEYVPPRARLLDEEDQKGDGGSPKRRQDESALLRDFRSSRLVSTNALNPERVLLRRRTISIDAGRNEPTTQFYDSDETQWSVVGARYAHAIDDDTDENDFQIMYRCAAPVTYLPWTQRTQPQNYVCVYRYELDEERERRTVPGRNEIGYLSIGRGRRRRSLEQTDAERFERETFATCCEMQTFVELIANIYHLTATAFTTTTTTTKLRRVKSDDFCLLLHEHVLRASSSSSCSPLDCPRKIHDYFVRHVDGVVCTLLSDERGGERKEIERRLKRAIASIYDELDHDSSRTPLSRRRTKHRPWSHARSTSLTLVSLVVNLLLETIHARNKRTIDRVLRTWRNARSIIGQALGRIRLAPGMLTFRGNNEPNATTTTALIGFVRNETTIRYLPFDMGKAKFVAKYERSSSSSSVNVPTARSSSSSAWQTKRIVDADGRTVEVSTKTTRTTKDQRGRMSRIPLIKRLHERVRRTSNADDRLLLRDNADDGCSVVVVRGIDLVWTTRATDGGNSRSIGGHVTNGPIDLRLDGDVSIEIDKRDLRRGHATGRRLGLRLPEKAIEFEAVADLPVDGVRWLLGLLATRPTTKFVPTRTEPVVDLFGPQFTFANTVERSMAIVRPTSIEQRPIAMIEQRPIAMTEQRPTATIEQRTVLRNDYLRNFITVLTNVAKLLELERILYVSKDKDTFEKATRQIGINAIAMRKVFDSTDTTNNSTDSNGKRKLKRLTHESLDLIVTAAEILLTNERYAAYEKLKILLSDNDHNDIHRTRKI